MRFLLPINRLWTRGLIGLAVLSVLLTACQAGSSTPAATPIPAPTAVDQAPPADAAATCGDKSKLAKTLHFYNWTNYMDDAILTEFERTCGVKVVQDTFASNEDLLAKLQAGASGYDLIIPSDYMIAVMRELNLLAALDFSHIPNAQNINPLFRNPPYDPEQKVSVPYQWGTTGLAYNTKRVKEAIDGWDDIFDAKKACAFGGLSMLNDAREVMGAALKLKGYSMNDTDPAHWAEAKEMVSAIKPCITTFDNASFADILQAGDVAVSQGFSGEFAKAIEANPDLTYLVPKEGTTIWVDNMAVPADAPSQYTAEIFINFLLRPDIGARLTNYTYYASPNEASKSLIKPEITGNASIYPPAEVMRKLEFLRDLGAATPLIEKLWTEIKSQ